MPDLLLELFSKKIPACPRRPQTRSVEDVQLLKRRPQTRSVEDAQLLKRRPQTRSVEDTQTENSMRGMKNNA